MSSGRTCEMKGREMRRVIEGQLSASQAAELRTEKKRYVPGE